MEKKISSLVRQLAAVIHSAATTSNSKTSLNLNASCATKLMTLFNTISLKPLFQADNAHEAIAEAVATTREAVDDLLKSAQEAPEALMSGLIDSISNSAKVCV